MVRMKGVLRILSLGFLSLVCSGLAYATECEPWCAAPYQCPRAEGFGSFYAIPGRTWLATVTGGCGQPGSTCGGYSPHVPNTGWRRYGDALSVTQVYSDCYRGEYLLQIRPNPINFRGCNGPEEYSDFYVPLTSYQHGSAVCIVGLLPDTPDTLNPCLKNTGLPQCCDYAIGDPINPLNGNFFESDVDYTIPGRGLDFRFERIYGSLESGGIGYPDSMLWRIPLGLGWTHAYNLYLDPTWLDTTRTLQFITRWDTVMYHDEQGNERLYMKTSNALSPAGDTLYKGEKGDRNLLGRKAGRFTLYREDGSRILFNNKGRADTIYDRNSNRIALAYSANDTGDLIKITDTRNRSIYLSYYPGTHRLRRIYEAPDSTNGRYYEYRYGVRRVTAVDTLTPPKSRYQLQQVLRHFPTGGEDSLIVLNRYYYDRDHRMITKVFPTGGHGSE